MISLFQKYQRFLMPVIAIVVIIAFVWFFNGSRDVSHSGNSSGVYVKMYGEGYSRTEVSRIGRKILVVQQNQQGERPGLAQILGLRALMECVTSAGMHQMSQVSSYLVMRHEADKLGITATDEEVQNYLMQIPDLQTNGQFDPVKYSTFIQDTLAPNGFSSDDLNSVIADNLRAQKLMALINSGVALVPSEVKALYTRQFEKTDSEVVRFSLSSVESSLTVSAADAKKTFDQQKDQFKSQEQRSVKLVNFSLNKTEQQLPDKERIQALQKLANKANNFTVAMTDPHADFDKLAAKYGGKVQKTGEFTISHPDPRIANEAAAVAAAFNLKKTAPNSDAIRTKNGFIALQLADTIPSRPLTFAEAESQVIAKIKNNRADQLLRTKAVNVRQKIAAALKSGQSFTQAVDAAGMKVETVPPFSLAEHDLDLPDAQTIMGKAFLMKSGQISEFVPTPTGGLLIYVAKREPIDEAQFKQSEPMLTTNIEQQKQMMAFGEWMQMQLKVANPAVLGS